jgi:hypothetical protein
MEDLIAALLILQKYVGKTYAPTGCEHDEFRVYVHPSKVSEEDTKELDRLGFIPDEDCEAFLSYRFGSA